MSDLHGGEHHAEQSGGEAQRQRTARPTTRTARAAGRTARAAGRRSRSSASPRSSAPTPARARPGGPPAATRAAAACPLWRRSRTGRGRKAIAGPERRELLRAHGGERVVAGAGCSRPKQSRMRDGADMRDQQVQKAGAPNLGFRVVAGDQEIGRQRHRFPQHHERHRRRRPEAPAPCWRETRGSPGTCRPGGVPSPWRK